MQLFGFVLLSASVAAMHAQTAAEMFQKAPPHVEEALRARIMKFYQAHVDGKFRLADELVAEDSKDIFFEAEKRRYRSFEIVKITYAQEYTLAQVLVTADTDVFFPGAGSIATRLPVSSHWRITGGDWFWYVPPREGYNSPFGTMKPGPSGDRAALPPMPKPEDALKILAAVKVDPTELTFPAQAEGSAGISIRNEMPGILSFTLEYPKNVGLDAKADKDSLKRDETARIQVAYQPGDTLPPPEIELRLHMQPTGQVVPIRVKFLRPQQPDSGR